MIICSLPITTMNTKEFIFTINYDGTKYTGIRRYNIYDPCTCWRLNAYIVIWYRQADGQVLEQPAALVSLIPGTIQITAFPNNGNPDTRAEFWTNGQNVAINDVTTFTDGYAITKWRNVTLRRRRRHQPTTFSDVDDAYIPLGRTLPDLC